MRRMLCLLLAALGLAGCSKRIVKE
ncbi:lipoprotein, partial [Pseudoxanthomonas mexicana]